MSFLSVGQLGRTPVVDNFFTTLTSVSGLSGIVAIATGPQHPIAATAGGIFYVWGGCHGWDGIVPNCTYSDHDRSTIIGAAPTSVDYSSYLEGSTIAQVAFKHGTAFFRRADGVIYGWGDNTFGQLCLGSTSANNYRVPQRVPLDYRTMSVVDIQVGLQSASFLTTSGEIYSCGNNTYGAFGSGTSSNMNRSPVRADLSAVGLSATKTISKWSVGLCHSLLLTSDNELWSWGAGGSNTLGYSDYTGLLSLPTANRFATLSPLRVEQNLLLKDRRITTLHASLATHVSAVPFLLDSNRTVATNSPRLRVTGSALYPSQPVTTLSPIASNQGSLPFVETADTYFDLNLNNNLTAGTELRGDIFFPASQEVLHNVKLASVVSRTDAP